MENRLLLVELNLKLRPAECGTFSYCELSQVCHRDGERGAELVRERADVAVVLHYVKA